MAAIEGKEAEARHLIYQAIKYAADIGAKKEYVDYFAHVQISAVRGRGEPDEGEINYAYVLTVLRNAGYDGLHWRRVQAPW